MSAIGGAIIGGVIGAVIVTLASKKKREPRPPSLPRPETQQDANALIESVPSEILEEIVSEINAGHKINAIKLIRDHTGLDLKTSKDIADQIEQKINP